MYSILQIPGILSLVFLYFFFAFLKAEAAFYPSRNLLQGSTRNNRSEPSCRNPSSYVCDCEVVPAELYQEIVEVFQGEDLNCVPQCEGAEELIDCEPECDEVMCVADFDDFCSVRLERRQVVSIREMDCKFSERILLHVCTRERFRMRVDVPTYIAATEGYCVSACGVQEEGLRCNFKARLFGKPYEPRDTEAPVEPPESETPVEPPEEYEIPAEEPEIEAAPPSSISEDYMYEIPFAPPSEEYIEYEPTEEPIVEEEYEIPESEPELELDYIVPEPSMELDDIVPEPSLDYLDYYYPVVAPMDAPIEIVEFEVPVNVSNVSLVGNQIYQGPWSNCSQYCAQAGSSRRERTVTCRNSFGIPLPISQCPLEQTIEFGEECEAVSCIGDFYYVLSEWSRCNQTCSTFDPDTQTMSTGARTRTPLCFFSNGTRAESVAPCLEAIEEGVLVDSCGNGPCLPVRYRVSHWGNCSCETRTRSRAVDCVDPSEEIVIEEMCGALEIQPPSRLQDCLPTGC